MDLVFGYFNYFAVPDNLQRLSGFRFEGLLGGALQLLCNFNRGTWE
jgi:hypothetical protein